MEESVKKKRKHWICRILGILLLLLLTAAVIMALWLVPKALRLRRALTSQSCAVNAEMSLNPRALSTDWQKLLRSLSLLTGLDEAEWKNLKLQGGYEAGTLELTVYTGEKVTPLSRLYLTPECQALDLHMVYDRTYDHLTEHVELLSHVLPQWGLGDYVALQQLEYAFGLDSLTSDRISDLQGTAERFQSRLSLPTLCGAVLAADQWDSKSRALVYHISDTDWRLEAARRLAEKTGHSPQTAFGQWPEGMTLDLVIYLGEPQVRMEITGDLPGIKQLSDWSAELVWEDYVSGSGEISLVDQQMINGFADLIKLLEALIDR